MKNIFFLIICGLLFLPDLHAQNNDNVIRLIEPISSKGTISFTFKTDDELLNGFNEEVIAHNLLELPGLGLCRLGRTHNYAVIQLYWQNKEEFMAAYIQTPGLPENTQFHIIFTWDAEEGIFDGYFNGINFRTENSDYYLPWQMIGSSDTLIIPESNLNLSDVKVTPKFITEEEAMNLVPKELLGKNENLLHDLYFPHAMKIENRKGKLIYSNQLDKEGSAENWIIEGPAQITFESESMIMESTHRNPTGGSEGHFNVWCPVDFPDSFIAEWEYQQLSDKGISLFFFSAEGKNGEDVFDTALVKRDGHFQPYVNGDINNYWIVTYSNNRNMRVTNMARCYLAKSSKSSILSIGKLGIEPGDRKFHKFRLIKDGAHIQFQVDGEVCLDFTDPGNERWGSVLSGGKFSFRQMAVTIAAYKNFNVWNIN